MAGNPPSGVPPAIFHHHHPMFTPATSSGDASPVASIFSGENSDAQFLSGLLPAVPGESTEKSGGGLRGGVLVTSPESSAFVPTDQGNFDGSMSMIPSGSAEPQAKSNNAKHGCRPASSATALTTAQEGVSVPCTEVVPHLESSPASQFDQKHFPAPVPSDDGYNWRKYGQKQVKGTDYPRSYYKCSHPDCSMKKKVGKSPDGLVIEIVYKGQHNHEPPQQSRRARETAVTLALDVRDANDAESLCLESGVGGKNGAILTNEIVVTHENTVVIGVIAPSPRSTSTNVKLTSEQIEKVVVDGRGGGTNGKNGALQGDGSCGPVGINEKAPADMHIASLGHSSSLLGSDHYWESSLLGRTDDSGPTTSGRLSGHTDFEDESYAGLRMDIVPVVEANSMHSFASDSTPSTPKTPREPRIVVQSNSEKESLDDGYRWRKYGQKIVKGNPNPRSYYKCTFMGCNVRKHVERASNNSSAVITTYEGKHNHQTPGAKTSSLDSPSTTGSAAKKLKTSRSFPSQQSISKALPGPAGNESHDMAPGPTIDIRGHQESSLVLNSATPKTVTESTNGPNTSIVKAVAFSTDGQSSAMVVMTSLSIGQEFPDAKSCRRAIKEIAIALRFDFKTVKSNPTCFTAKCSKDGCPWRVHASKLPCGPRFTIRTLKGNHTCGGIDDLSHKQASVDWVASVIEQRLRENPRYKPKEIVQDILQEHGIAISYKQAYRGKERSMENIYGSYEGGYRLLNVYCNQIRTVNRGSVAFIVTDNVEHRFQRLFVAIHASIFGFVNACRPLLGIDGARLKGKYQGVLFSATAVDAEGGLFPLAFGVVDEESNENWMWFLSELRNLLEKHMETIPMLSIFSNRQKGVVEAVTAHFPFAFHGLYLRHLSENLKKKFGNKAIVRLFLNAAYSLTITDFEANMVKIEEISTEAAEWVRQFSPQLWATAYIEGAQFGHLTSNMVEQFNSWVLEARDLPIVQMMEHIHQGLITRFEKRQEQAMSWTSIYVPSIEKRLSETLSYARRCKVYQANEVEFEIVSSQGTHGVHLCDRYCSCRGWQIYGIPCTHAVAALLNCQQDVYQFVNKCFTVENFRKAYSEAIHPVSDKSLWMNNREQSSDPFDVTAGDSEDVIVHPPICRRSSGPPVKKKKED